MALTTCPTNAIRTCTNAEMLVRGLALEPLPNAPSPVPAGTVCAMTGVPITRGYTVADITTDATNEFLDTFRGQGAGYVCESVGRAFRQDWNLGARLFMQLADGSVAHYHPLINIEAAVAQKRPCWSTLVRNLWPGAEGFPVLIILTTDTKKRLWPRARVGPLGARTPVYLHDGKTDRSGVVWLDWPVLVSTLDTTERVYIAGFTKAAIQHGLHREWKQCLLVGIAAANRLEAALKPLRTLPEWAPALLIAQKPLEEKS